ncbi:MAG: transcriptional repressor [Gammaproteobacteria bacterium]|nr:transcriptional repressor [Gammaproteobacteria bacterium]
MKNTHDHHICQSKALQHINEQCRKKNIRLTPIRQQVFDEILQSHKAIKAYDILQNMSTPGEMVKPPTVYRAIDFLLEHGFIHKIESLNAFIACYHEHNKDCFQLLICDECGTVSEQINNKISHEMKLLSEKENFTLQHPIIELHGTCFQCNTTGTKS